MIGIGEIEIAGRLLLGGGIGLERQVHGRPAGFRTHLLVCVASVLLMTVSRSLGGDPGRLAAGTITIASEHRISEREIVDALGVLPAVRHVRVQA